MEFTYEAFRRLTSKLQSCGYQFCSYHDWNKARKCVIYRHDIDTDLKKAVELAHIENELGVNSTYFVLLTSDFYNVASSKNRAFLRQIIKLGHEIGLHFDETAYNSTTGSQMVENILCERDILSSILGVPITTVSMHRPSKTTLEAELQIPNMINSYCKTFFHDFKYLSDSRHRWREPVWDVVCSGEYDRLHILTHAFWYYEEEKTISETVSNFVNSGNRARYSAMSENIADLSSIMQESEVR